MPETVHFCCKLQLMLKLSEKLHRDPKKESNFLLVFVFPFRFFPEALVIAFLRTLSRDCYFCDDLHCVKSVLIWSYSCPYFPSFGLNTGRYGVSLRIQSKCGKIQTRITPNTDTFKQYYCFCFYNFLV